MSKTILFSPITVKEQESLFLKLVSIKFKINIDLLESMRHYFASDSLRPDSKFDLYYILNMFAGQNLKFPTIDQQYKILRDVNIYIDVEREYKQEMNYTDFLISLGSKYNLPSTEIHAVYNDCKFMIQGEEAMRRK